VPLLLCDLDGTLVDRAGAFRRWATDLATRVGMDGDFVEWIIEVDDDGAVSRERLYEVLGARLALDETREEFVARYGECFSRFFEPDAAIAAALERARAKGWSIAVVTNGEASQARKIAAVRLESLIDVVCISAVEGVWKPDPELLRLAATRASADLEGAWLIGDSAHADIGAATAAGIRSIWLRRGRQWPRDDYEPTHEADSFDAAIGLILAT
jgi:putative hydrolase of the HAD superfamily